VKQVNTVTTIESAFGRIAFETTKRRRRRWVRSNADIVGMAREPDAKTSVKAVVEAILKRDLDTLSSSASSTTAEILQDPVWKARLRASLAQARTGETRPIEDYWSESD
jgi:hypothetical protein